MKLTIFVLMFSFITAAIPALALDIVIDGQPRAEIVVAKDARAGTVNAAKDLQYFVKEISGAYLSIVNEPGKDNLAQIYVGENQFTAELGYKLPKFTSSGYDILVQDCYAVLSGPHTFYPDRKYKSLAEFQEYMGDKYTDDHFTSGNGYFNKPLGIYDNDDIGAWHAVSALLERLGVRFYAPYADGTIVPKIKNIVLQTGRETKQAAFERRQWFYSVAMHNDAEGIAWLKRMKCGTRTGIVANHTTMGLIRNPEMKVLHPSWFAEEAPGKLFKGAPGFRQGEGGVPRYTDPDFIRACIDWARKLFAMYPDVSQVTIGAPDDAGGEEAGDPYDWRDQKIYQKPGMSHKQAYANMMWDFHVAIARELKKSHPDKGLIWWCLYNNNLPTNIVRENQPDNILCRIEAIPPSHYVRKDKNKEFFQHIDAQWNAFKPRGKSQQWEWWLDYQWPTSPRYPQFFMHTLQKTRQKQIKYFDGFFMETARQGERLSDVPISHLMMYVNNKLMWDPYLDLDALLAEYYRLWFGPAEKEMKAFHQYAEEIWSRSGSRSVSEVNGFLKRDDIPRYFKLLAAAKAKTVPGSIYYKRIAEMEEGYSGLKTLFEERTPKGPPIKAVEIASSAKADGDFSKYQGEWYSLTKTSAPEKNRAEFAVALTKDRKQLLFAIRCYEENMNGLKQATHTPDISSIFQDDYVEISINTPEKSWFSIAINPAGAVWDESRDLEIINRDALPILWSPGTKAHVKKFTDRWEVEVSIPTADFGTTGPSLRHPWGINVSRFRALSEEKQSFTPAATSQWARLAKAQNK